MPARAGRNTGATALSSIRMDSRAARRPTKLPSVPGKKALFVRAWPRPDDPSDLLEDPMTSTTLFRRSLLRAAAFGAVLALAGARLPALAADPVKEIRIDYATYNPVG